MITEEQAKKLWCSQVRFDNDTNDNLCIASGCMMWRWSRTVFATLESEIDKKVQHKTGYCGLAGKPE